MYRKAIELSERIEEKKLSLAGVQKVHTPGALEFVEGYLSHDQLAGEAVAAYLAITVGMRETYPEEAIKATAKLQELGGGKITGLAAGFTATLGPRNARLTPPMTLQTDDSGVLHTVVPTDSEEVVEPGKGGKAEYIFTTLAAGKLSMEIRIRCEGDSNDSWYVTVDDKPLFTWNNNATKGWQWKEFPRVYRIGAGPHTLTFEEREDGARMGGIRLTLSAE